MCVFFVVSVCNNKVLTTPTGELTSPAFPNYPQNMRCQWLIRVAKGKNIELKFSYIRLKGILAIHATRMNKKSYFPLDFYE